MLNGLLPDPSEGTQLSSQHIGRLFVFSIMWSIGAALELDDRVKMEVFIKQNLDLDLPNVEEYSNQTIFEYFVDKEGMNLQILKFYNFELSFLKT